MCSPLCIQSIIVKAGLLKQNKQQQKKNPTQAKIIITLESETSAPTVSSISTSPPSFARPNGRQRTLETGL